MKPYKLITTPALTQLHVQKRLKFARWWRKNKADGLKDIQFWMFSDEKIFTVDGGLNNQNARIYAHSREEANQYGGLAPLQKFPTKIMVWVGLTKKGATEPYFIDPSFYFLVLFLNPNNRSFLKKTFIQKMKQ